MIENVTIASILKDNRAWEDVYTWIELPIEDVDPEGKQNIARYSQRISVMRIVEILLDKAGYSVYNIKTNLRGEN